MAYEKDNNLTMARHHYGELLRNYPGSILGYNVAIGMMAVKEQRWSDAKNLLEQALAMNPHAPQVLTHLGIAAMAQTD